jgi:dolichol-phosphate mannosyltransferase
VVIPTLNEEMTIGLLLDQLGELYPGVTVIVVDDGSRDQTPLVVQNKAKTLEGVVKVCFLDRNLAKDKGLTASVCEGILQVETPFCVVMDGDLQHPPEVVEKLLSALRMGADLVVGCRSRLHWNQQPHRFFITLIFTGLASLTLRFRGIRLRDPMSGLFGVSSTLFQECYRRDSRYFVGEGYKVLFDFCRASSSARHKTVEVLYDFGTRKGGGSKAAARHAVAFLRSLIK